MPFENLVIRSQLLPPQAPKNLLRRPRLEAQLAAILHYPVTLVQAGTGYGKSTALAALDDQVRPLFWYTITEPDRDPLLFLVHLLSAFNRDGMQLGTEALRNLAASGSRVAIQALTPLLNTLTGALTTEAVLVLDDYHLVDDIAEIGALVERLIDYRPPRLHIVIATRRSPPLSGLVRWRVKDQLLTLSNADLAFTAEEIQSLFRETYHVPLSPPLAETLTAITEGWGIALQMIRQSLYTGHASLESILARPYATLEGLFDYLAQDVLARQPGHVQDFLLATSVLREMDPQTCNTLLGIEDSAKILEQLHANGLFVVAVNPNDSHLPRYGPVRIPPTPAPSGITTTLQETSIYRYHRLFHDFLREQLGKTPERPGRLHRQAADYYLYKGRHEDAVFHLMEAQALTEAARCLKDLGRKMVRAGRLETLAGWIHALPPDILETHPFLLVYLGDIARLHSRFDEALGWYRQAEQRFRTQGDQSGIGRALRGQARVYLDTVNPSEAEHLLQAALRLSDGQEDREARARLMELMAENRLNLGSPEESESLLAQARELRDEGPSEAELPVRVLLRTGQLEQARRVLEKRAVIEEQIPVLRPRAHRETLLLLALILALQGEAEQAYHYAVEGSKRGQMLQSPFITAVGYMRQGHAWLIRDTEVGYTEANLCYQEAIRLSDTLAVPRLKVEAYWGLCRSHGFRGAIQEAEKAAELGLAIAKPAGDEWIAALIRASLGSSYVLNAQHDAAAHWLQRAYDGFHSCGDPYGEAVSRLWQCLLWWETGESIHLEHALNDLCQLVRENGYEYLFTHNTLQGPTDMRRVLPILLHARTAPKRRAYAEQLLALMGFPDLELHPGYQLRVRTLGPFQLWRGAEEVLPQEWRRENARSLFQVLVTFRGQMLDRDQIVEMLWPGLDPDTALRDFKVALSTLFKVLEPERNRGAPSAYVTRDGTLYGLRPGADVWVDADSFEAAINAGNTALEHGLAAAQDGITHYRRALALYAGDYLSEYPYDDWCSEERERLLTQFLRMADRLAQIYAERDEWKETLEVCQAILAQDDCWERAYRLMMIAYNSLGNRTQALRTYRRCVERLQDELGIEPAPETTALYTEISQYRSTF
ncbi:MAG: transcriptional regulator [Anaerolineae bacterium]|nr:transcriptional regulator [Anaerolineae bacterium]